MSKMSGQQQEVIIAIAIASFVLLGAAAFSAEESVPATGDCASGDRSVAANHARCRAHSERARAAPKSESSTRRSPLRATSKLLLPCARPIGITGFFRGRGGKHDGIDINAAAGTPVLASEAGMVRSAEWNGGYGKDVVIDHPNGLRTRYAHNSVLLVTRGQRVRRGQRIALVGATGHATGPHIHYEVFLHGTRVNPFLYLQ
ncbi:M23 family metallopeptidase [Candidatus Uhrbacteria bacterium]|nr:M23 family metallopeptidase [Candidatus Uhrbacteria bacterium]